VTRRAEWLGAALAMFVVAWGANQFVSTLVAYRSERGVSVAVNDGLFGIYAVALILALLLCGPAADIWGRARLVRPAVLVAMVGSVLLMAGDHSVGLLFAGRFVAGVASGAVFAAGTAWLKELSPAGEESSAPTRAALALSAGFGLGPVITGVVAQWAPHPLVVAYVPHLLVSLAVLPVVLRAPETVPAAAGTAPTYRQRLRVRSAASRRFLTVVLPAAPWVFAAPSLSFAVQPSQVGSLHGYAVLYSALVVAVTLGSGVAAQTLSRRVPGEGGAPLLLGGLAVIVVGCLVSALAIHLTDPWVAVGAALPLGVGYGLTMLGGLRETQRIAGPGELAGLTGIYYALTYVGFALPLVLATLHPVAGYPTMIVVVAVLVSGCGALVAVSSRRGDRA
jgi:MFS family permease